jgi:hypothetical protein
MESFHAALSPRAFEDPGTRQILVERRFGYADLLCNNRGAFPEESVEIDIQAFGLYRPELPSLAT